MIRVRKIVSTIGWLQVIGCLFANTHGYCWSLASGVLTEDFTDLAHLDKTQSTGLWNIVDHAAQAGRVAGGTTSRAISFGDGSDGVLDSSTGYTFDTDAHPNGYSFISVNISSGTISVRGSSPLIIRSLSTITLTPPLSVRGGDGLPGVPDGSLAGPSGGTPIASSCAGGKGGDADNTPTGDGGGGVTYDGTLELSGGSGNSGGNGGAAVAGPFDSPGAPSNWETSAIPPDFRCGAGGSGGGGYTDVGSHATGGSGGAGGGTVKLVAVGPIQFNSIDARGGDGGVGATSGFCSGSGAGGNGGAVWLQTLQTISGPTPLVNEGSTATNCSGASGAGFPGVVRQDSATTSDPSSFPTAQVAVGQTYQLQSTPYDLGTQNAGFFSAPTINTNLNGGIIDVTYAGSVDGVSFSELTSDITTLSNQKYRYLKFKITIQTAATAGLTPQVTSVAIPFAELDIRLVGGCGSLTHQKNRIDPLHGALSLLGWIFIFWMMDRINRPGEKMTTEQS